MILSVAFVCPALTTTFTVMLASRATEVGALKLNKRVNTMEPKRVQAEADAAAEVVGFKEQISFIEKCIEYLLPIVIYEVAAVDVIESLESDGESSVKLLEDAEWVKRFVESQKEETASVQAMELSDIQQKIKDLQKKHNMKRKSSVLERLKSFLAAAETGAAEKAAAERAAAKIAAAKIAAAEKAAAEKAAAEIVAAKKAADEKAAAKIAAAKERMVLPPSRPEELDARFGAQPSRRGALASRPRV
jgi:TolA-binding protein